MLEQDITQKRKERHHITQEDFTPIEIVKQLCDNLPNDLYTDFSKTFCDPCMGTGNIILYVLEKRLMICKSSNDVINALSTLYGVELMQDNVDECKERVLDLLDKMNIDYDKSQAIKIMDKNLICSDFFEWDFENWRSKKIISNPLF